MFSAVLAEVSPGAEARTHAVVGKGRQGRLWILLPACGWLGLAVFSTAGHSYSGRFKAIRRFRIAEASGISRDNFDD